MVITTIDSFVHTSLVRWRACVSVASYAVPLEMHFQYAAVHTSLVREAKWGGKSGTKCTGSNIW
jgi:hypothetical protein